MRFIPLYLVGYFILLVGAGLACMAVGLVVARGRFWDAPR